ncbi:MAG: Hsp33 family molecular chaperone HslO, partial [Pseudomonadota bacterium]|nr:Hsp33 family molecular chaperone HslO [Pseudomonadota bacterium]
MKGYTDAPTHLPQGFPMRDGDTLQRFLFEHSNVRGLFIHLNASYAAVSERYDYPMIVRQQLGEALAAS